MIRFVDGSKDLGEDGYTFAWWDTIVSQFHEYNGTQAWETWEEFEQDFNSERWLWDEGIKLLERFKGLYPEGKK